MESIGKLELCVPGQESEWRHRKDIERACTHINLKIGTSSQVSINPQGKEKTSNDTGLQQSYCNLKRSVRISTYGGTAVISS